NYDIDTEIYVAEIEVEPLRENAVFDKTYKPLPKFPASQRDIAMLVKDEVTVADIEKILREKGGKLLENIKLFDVYKGKQIEDGFKSVAYTLTFRASDRNITAEEINSPMNKIIKELEEKLSAQLREK
ncbi:MAG: phenylalanine--tRNA ligase subunit beta, partial [Firmicutes bacterium]|nr:phenylalanine--tRNA ligase subunit beta [Bacillota bacterium]